MQATAVCHMSLHEDLLEQCSKPMSYCLHGVHMLTEVFNSQKTNSKERKKKAASYNARACASVTR